MAVTAKVAAAPGATVSETGCAVIAGAMAAAVTETIAGRLVTFPAEFATTTSYEPADPAETAPRLSVADVAPASATPSRRHW